MAPIQVCLVHLNKNNQLVAADITVYKRNKQRDKYIIYVLILNMTLQSQLPYSGSLCHQKLYLRDWS
jgi:hypothetical protein